MKLSTVLVSALTLAAGAIAVEPKKSVVVTYDMSTPDWVVSQAKQAIVDAGGLITHEYNIIKGFAATAGEKVIGAVSAMNVEYKANIEEDQLVTANTK